MRIAKVSAMELNEAARADGRIQNLISSLNPLLVWNRIIAIEFFKSKVLTILGYLLFLINLAVQVISLFNWLNAEKVRISVISSTFLTSRTMSQINYSIRNIGIHFCLLVSVRRKWQKLAESIDKMDRFVQRTNQNVYRRYRNLSILGILYIIILVIRIGKKID